MSLIARLQPRNLSSERERLLRAWNRGRHEQPAFEYSQRTCLRETRYALDGIVVAAAFRGGIRWALLSARAAELALEAELAEARDTSSFREIAERRFPAPKGWVARECDALVKSWAAEPDPDNEGPASRSDDESSKHSLISVLKHAAAAARIPLVIQRAPALVSTAAVSGRSVLIRPGQLLSLAAARRIAVHEMLGHWLPRHVATMGGCCLARVGTAAAGDDEEGRALLLEQRFGLLRAARRNELAGRHAVAHAVRQGAEFGDVVRLARARGEGLETAIDIAMRAFRGGGLGRELVYLAGFVKLRAVDDSEPGLLRWLESGRFGLEAARTLAADGQLPDALALRESKSLEKLLLPSLLPA